MGFLVQLFRAGKDDRQQFTALLRPHVELLHRMAWRWTGSQADAEDLVQEVLIKLSSRVEEMAGIENLRPWLLRVLYHRYVDLYRSHRNSPVVPLSALQDGAQDNEDLLLDFADTRDEIAQLQLRDTLEQALAQLDEDQRTLILLHDAEGYSDLEAAEILGLSIGTVKSRLHRARARMKKFLETGTN